MNTLLNACAFIQAFVGTLVISLNSKSLAIKLTLSLVILQHTNFKRFNWIRLFIYSLAWHSLLVYSLLSAFCCSVLTIDRKVLPILTLFGFRSRLRPLWLCVCVCRMHFAARANVAQRRISCSVWCCCCQRLWQRRPRQHRPRMFTTFLQRPKGLPAAGAGRGVLCMGMGAKCGCGRGPSISAFRLSHAVGSWGSCQEFVCAVFFLALAVAF